MVKNSPANVGDKGLILCGRSPGEGNGNALQYSCLDSPTHRGAWRATVHGFQGVRHDLATKQQQHSRSREAMRQRCRQHTFRASLPRDPGKVQRLSGFLAPWKQGRSSSYVSEVLWGPGELALPMSRGWVLRTLWTLYLVVQVPHFIEPSHHSGSANLLLHFLIRAFGKDVSLPV